MWLAFVAAFFVLHAEIKRRKLEVNPEVILGCVAIAGIVGAKFWHLIDTPEDRIPLGMLFSWEGLLSLVPRALWPEKPVFAGSPQIVSKMTGLRLSPTTSFGVGNVMEFQINFGTPGVVVGFFVLGWLIGMLDLKAAAAERRGDLGKVIVFFLPAVALVNPQGSLVEMFSGSAAALVGALAWNMAWKRFVTKRSTIPEWAAVRSANRTESPPYKHESAT